MLTMILTGINSNISMVKSRVTRGIFACKYLQVVSFNILWQIILFMRVISIIILLSFFSCSQNTNKNTVLQIQGTWQLLTGRLIEKGDTTVTDYTKGKRFIKIINDTHFAFLNHDLSKGSDSSALFSCGGGKYSLNDSNYTEHLEYCNNREWEGNTFQFTVTVHNDTLIQKGIEKVADLGIERLNIEQYVRTKD